MKAPLKKASRAVLAQSYLSTAGGDTASTTSTSSRQAMSSAKRYAEALSTAGKPPLTVRSIRDLPPQSSVCRPAKSLRQGIPQHGRHERSHSLGLHRINSQVAVVVEPGPAWGVEQDGGQARGEGHGHASRSSSVTSSSSQPSQGAYMSTRPYWKVWQVKCWTQGEEHGVIVVVFVMLQMRPAGEL